MFTIQPHGHPVSLRRVKMAGTLHVIFNGKDVCEVMVVDSKQDEHFQIETSPKPRSGVEV